MTGYRKYAEGSNALRARFERLGIDPDIGPTGDASAPASQHPPVFGADQLPNGHRWPDDEPEPVHQLLEGGYCPTCGGSCLIGFGNP